MQVKGRMPAPEESFLQNVETRFGGIQLFASGLSFPTDTKDVKVKHHLSIPPSVPHHRAITLARRS